MPGDLPYAGLLAWQGTVYAWDANVSDQLSLYLGMVGPASLAEPAQKGIHNVIGADEPKGWQYQLNNEPVVKIELQRTWTLYRNDSKRLQYDVVGLGVFSLQADRHVNPLAFMESNDFYVFALSSTSSKTKTRDEREKHGAFSVTYRF